jgi:hypothetical protein
MDTILKVLNYMGQLILKMDGTIAGKKVKLDSKGITISWIFGLAQFVITFMAYHNNYGNDITALALVTVVIGSFISYVIYDIKRYLKIEYYTNKRILRALCVYVYRVVINFINWFAVFCIVGIISAKNHLGVEFNSGTWFSTLIVVLYILNIVRITINAFSESD